MSTRDSLREERGGQYLGADLFRSAMDASPYGIALQEGEVLLYRNPAWDSMMKAETGVDSGNGNSSTFPAAIAGREIVTSTYKFDYCGTAVSLIVARDVSEERNAERQRREAQKLEALGRWVGGVVHDFNNMLTAVMLYSDMVAQTADANSAIARYNEEIRDVAKRGAGLTGQLLAFLQQRSFARTVISTNSLLEGLRDLLERMIGEDVPVFFELAPEACHVNMNPAQLQQVVFNLALNARDAMGAGGKLAISTNEEEANLGRGLQKCVRLKVADTGCGMDASTKERIFEPFFTTKPEGKGTGLGLTIVQEIVHEAGGVIVVDSEPGAGTVVSILLPRAEPGVKHEKGDAAQLRLATGSETLLIVEDDAAVRSSMVEALVGRGYQVLQAANGYEALQVARDFAYDIHLLITDLVLPGISGRDLARRLQSERAGTRVMFVSGYGIDPCCGTDIIFEKPFNSGALAIKVREALAGSFIRTSDPVGR
jgi:two-component system, cell cycle sensor histidine kinase and response regulator CckA